MRYVEYGHINNKGEFESALGDRSVVILDVRNSIKTSINDAFKYNGYRRPVYSVCRICQGESLLRSKPITKNILLMERNK